jgi:hypothetical protein
VVKPLHFRQRRLGFALFEDSSRGRTMHEALRVRDITRRLLTGISDAVAETIVDLGIDWREVETLADLQTGLRLVMGTP